MPTTSARRRAWRFCTGMTIRLDLISHKSPGRQPTEPGSGRLVGIFRKSVSVSFASNKPVSDRGIVRCRHCQAKADLIVSMVNPKDGQVLSIFRCGCEKLTAISGAAVRPTAG
jgi:hypothetical protein